MDAWGSDLLLHVIQYLALEDSGKFAATNRRHLYLVRNYQKLIGPQLVSSTSSIPGVRSRQRTLPEVVRHATAQLQTRPTFGFYFGSSLETEAAETVLPNLLPAETILLGVKAGKIQCCGPELECRSSSSLFLGNFPDAAVVPFHATGPATVEQIEQQVGSITDVQVGMIYACGEFDYSELQAIIKRLQLAHPTASIVGGVCDGGVISVPFEPATLEELEQLPAADLRIILEKLGADPPDSEDALIPRLLELFQTRRLLSESMDNGLFGVVMAGPGKVPVRSVVSRGMRSLTFKNHPQPETPFYIKEAYYQKPGDPGNLFQNATNIPPYHQVSKIEDRSTGTVYTYQDMVREFGHGSLLGIRAVDEDGFSMYDFHQLSSMVNAFLLFDDGLGTDPIVGRNVDLFELDGEACLYDMDLRMQQLKEALKDEKLLGAIMISCNGRGPDASSMLQDDMADAKRFSKAFPGVPCLGFYAGGEIGPLAQAARKEVFQTGKAALQGFTAVFAVFIVPEVDLSKVDLDDRQENINEFLANYRVKQW